MTMVAVCPSSMRSKTSLSGASARYSSRVMVQVPEQGQTNLVGMKVDHDIKNKAGEPIVRGQSLAPTDTG